MRNNVSIYTEEGRTTVCFGRGRICVVHTEDKQGQQLIWLGDTRKDREVGVYTKEVKGWT